jgi:predicted alpha/beta superfamily hydrolase
MGSSMGGLVSLYAISEYPEIFGGAGCSSTNWPAGENEPVDEMAKTCQTRKHISCILITAQRDWTYSMDRIKDE